jgi:hypothetical protein
MFGKKQSVPAEHPMRARARSRLEMLPDHEILNWADQAGSGLAKALDDYRRLRDADSLRDAESGTAALAGAIDALLARQH